jgi:hypothetical protein
MLEAQALQSRRASQAQDPTKLSGSPFQLILQMLRDLGDGLTETKPKCLKLVHIFTSSHSGESWVLMMSMASLPSVMTTNIAISKATAIHTRKRM